MTFVGQLNICCFARFLLMSLKSLWGSHMFAQQKANQDTTQYSFTAKFQVGISAQQIPALPKQEHWRRSSSSLSVLLRGIFPNSSRSELGRCHSWYPGEAAPNTTGLKMPFYQLPLFILLQHFKTVFNHISHITSGHRIISKIRHLALHQSSIIFIKYSDVCCW